MIENPVDKCKSFINSQFQKTAETGRLVAAVVRPTITLSRQTGSGARSIAEKLAAYLQERDPARPSPWTVFDKNLVQRILEDHHLPERLARYVPEERVSEIDYAVEELLGLHPSSWTMIQHTTETILRLAQLGNVILIGRAAFIVASKLKNAFHVRLIASVEARVARIQEFYCLNRRQAEEFLRHEDRQRKRYVKRYFGRNIEDPLLYHLSINTDLVSYDEATRIIGDAVLRRRQSLMEKP